MKRSGIQPKASWKRLERSRTPMKRGKRINPIGPKTKAWSNTRVELKAEFEFQYGITTCELRYEGCWRDNALGFAHAAKRRKLTREDLKHVILCCNPCHDQIEFLSPEEMKRIVDETIQNRASLAAARMLA